LFGRAESLGRGLLDWFVRTLEAGIPVLTAVREPYDEAWAGFHGGLAADLEPDAVAVCDWVLTNIGSGTRELPMPAFNS